MNTLKYILRHGWLWPFEFWLRPFTVQARMAKNDWRELWSAIAGFTILGTLVGLLMWLADCIALENTWMVAALFAGTFAVAAAVAGGVVMGGNSFFIIMPIYSYFVVIVFVLSGQWLEYEFVMWFLPSSLFGLIITFFNPSASKDENFIDTFLALTLLLCFALLSFAHIFNGTSKLANLWGLSTVIALAAWRIAFMGDSFSKDPLPKNIRHAKNQPILYLTAFFIPALAAWFNPYGSEALKSNLHIIACYLFITPFCISEFIAYPLFLFAAWRLYNHNHVKQHICPFSTPLLKNGQSLSLPLPRLKRYLTLVVEKDVKLGYATLRAVQTQSYQGSAARKAAQLVLHEKGGLTFSGYLAVNTNEATLAQLRGGPPVARSVASLAAIDQDNLKEGELLLSIYESTQERQSREKSNSNKPLTETKQVKKRNHRNLDFLRNYLVRKQAELQRGDEVQIRTWAWWIYNMLYLQGSQYMAAEKQQSEEDKLPIIKQPEEGRLPIIERLTNSRSFLAQGPECEGKEKYDTLLSILQQFTGITNFQQLCQYQLNEPISEDTSWLYGGWQIISQLEKHCCGMIKDYLSWIQVISA